MLPLFRGENGARDTLRFIEEKLALGLWAWNLKTRVVEWSPGLFRLLGLDPNSAEPSYSLYESLIHPEDRPPFGEIEQILNQAGPIERQFRVLLSNHRCRYILNRGEVLLDEVGRPDRAIGLMVDVTPFHEAQLNVEALRECCAKILDLIPAMIWTLNGLGAVEVFSGADKFTGLPLRSGGVDGWLHAVHPEDQAGVRAAWQSAIDRRHNLDLEFRLDRGDGACRWVRARGSPSFNKDGSIHEWMVVYTDIHEQKVWAPNGNFRAITGAQLRAARGILNWSVRELADASAVSASAIRRLEETDGLPWETDGSFGEIKKALEDAGIEFLFPPLGKPGVRPR